MRYTLILVLAISVNAHAETVTFDTRFDVSDVIEGQASGVAAADSLTINTDNRRIGPVSLSKFDPSLGQLNSVSLSVEFDRILVDIPINFSSASGGAITASIDELSLQRGYVAAAFTGLTRPLVIGSGVQSLDLNELNTDGLLTSTSSPGELNIQAEFGGFPVNNIRLSTPDIVEGSSSFSFVGTDSFELVRRTTNALSISLDQDNFDFDISGGSIEYSGTISVAYDFTPALNPILGDFDDDGDVDGGDFLTWQRDPSIASLQDWRDNFGTNSISNSLVTVPEPTTWAMLSLGGLMMGARRRR